MFHFPLFGLQHTVKPNKLQESHEWVNQFFGTSSHWNELKTLSPFNQNPHIPPLKNKQQRLTKPFLSWLKNQMLLNPTEHQTFNATQQFAFHRLGTEFGVKQTNKSNKNATKVGPY